MLFWLKCFVYLFILYERSPNITRPRMASSRQGLHLNDLGCQPRSRHDTSWNQQRHLPPCSQVINLVPLKYSSRKLRFPFRVPMERMPWCPCPFKIEADRLANQLPPGEHCQLLFGLNQGYPSQSVRM